MCLWRREKRGESPPGYRMRPVPNRTDRLMSGPIRTEVLAGVHTAFGDLEYGVLGGAALAQYGSQRGTNDVDIIVPHSISEVVAPQLLRAGLVRTQGGLGYVASDGQCYGVDVTSDRDVSQQLRGRGADTTTVSNHPARILTLPFLLNSKAYAFLTRFGPDAAVKRNNDGQDLIFILQQIRRLNIAVDSRRCRWVVDYDFWMQFAGQYQAENLLTGVGLRRDATPSNSNRSSRSSFAERNSLRNSLRSSASGGGSNGRNSARSNSPGNGPHRNNNGQRA